MTQDFAKIRPEPLLEKKPVEAPPAWSLMITGVLVGVTIGVFACVLFYLSGNVPPLNAAQANMAAAPAFSETANLEEESNAATSVDFEFYTELPRYEVPTDATPVALASEEVTGTFILQTGAFRQMESAEQEVQRQLALGLDFFVKTEELTGSTLYLVQTGPYSTQVELNEALQVLQRANIPTLTLQLQ